MIDTSIVLSLLDISAAPLHFLYMFNRFCKQAIVCVATENFILMQTPPSLRSSTHLLLIFTGHLQDQSVSPISIGLKLV